jgi:thiaminase/transcriptional activator TenA
MGFVQEMIDGSMDLWNGYLVHPFLLELADGSLPEEKIKRYIIEDSLYLKGYARVFAIGLLKAQSMADMVLMSKMITGTVEGEYATRDRYLKGFGMNPDDWEQFIPSKENQAYVDFMIQCAEEGELPEVLAATLPCMLSYCYIGRELVKKDPNGVKQSRYADIIDDYANDAYYESCQKNIAYADRIFENLSDERKEKLKAMFRKASEYEMDFWEMSYQNN